MNTTNDPGVTKSEPRSLHHRIFFKFLALGVAGAVIWCLLSELISIVPADWRLSNAQQERLTLTIKAEMPAAVESKFRELHAEVPRRFPAPTLVYEGALAAVIDVTPPDYDSGGHLIGNHPLYRMGVLAKTGAKIDSAGHYFFVNYSLALDGLEDCAKAPANCLTQDPIQTLSTDEAKAAYFNSPNFKPEVYQRLFGEAPPARKVAA